MERSTSFFILGIIIFYVFIMCLYFLLHYHSKKEYTDFKSPIMSNTSTETNMISREEIS